MINNELGADTKNLIDNATKVIEKNKELQNRINKAIKEVEWERNMHIEGKNTWNFTGVGIDIAIEHCDDLLEILKGEDKE